MRGQFLAGTAIALIAAGCSNGQIETTSGSVTMGFDYETVDLPLLLTRGPNAGVAPAKSELPASTQNDLALAAYHKWEQETATPEEEISSRNQIQDRLIGASNQLCHKYELYMQDLSSQGNFWAGLFTTAAATAGALVSGGASQIFAGAAAVASGGRAEFNQDFFYKEAVPAIFKGIRAKRTDVLNAILAKRSQPVSAATLATDGSEDAASPGNTVGRIRVPVQDYTVEAAIADAIDYHWQCSLASGIAHLGSLATLSEEVGVKAARNFNNANTSDGRASVAISNLLAVGPRAQSAINASATGFPAATAAMKLPSGKTVKDSVASRQAGQIEKVTACTASAMTAASSVSTAQQAVAAAQGNADAVKLDALNAAIANGNLIVTQIQFGPTRFSDELNALSKGLAALPVDAGGAADPAAVEKAVSKAFPGDKPADLGCETKK